jgi:hypothetical protein
VLAGSTIRLRSSPAAVAFRAVFYVAGSILAGWAVLLAFLGIKRENFPASAGAARVVAGISIVLVAGAIFCAIYSGITEEEEEHEGESAAAAVLPS